MIKKCFLVYPNTLTLQVKTMYSNLCNFRCMFDLYFIRPRLRRCYMAGILPIRRNTQTINQSDDCHSSQYFNYSSFNIFTINLISTLAEISQYLKYRKKSAWLLAQQLELSVSIKSNAIETEILPYRSIYSRSSSLQQCYVAG